MRAFLGVCMAFHGHEGLDGNSSSDSDSESGSGSSEDDSDSNSDSNSESESDDESSSKSGKEAAVAPSVNPSAASAGAARADAARIVRREELEGSIGRLLFLAQRMQAEVQRGVGSRRRPVSVAGSGAARDEAFSGAGTAHAPRAARGSGTFAGSDDGASAGRSRRDMSVQASLHDGRSRRSAAGRATTAAGASSPDERGSFGAPSRRSDGRARREDEGEREPWFARVPERRGPSELPEEVPGGSLADFYPFTGALADGDDQSSFGRPDEALRGLPPAARDEAVRGAIHTLLAPDYGDR